MRWKLDTHSIQCIFFGYNDKSKAYQLMTTNKIFGCKAHAFIHKETRWKLDTHSIYCIFLGYNDKSKAYRLMTTNGPQILTSRDIIFYETHMKSHITSFNKMMKLKKNPYLMQTFFSSTWLKFQTLKFNHQMYLKIVLKIHSKISQQYHSKHNFKHFY